MLPETIDLFKVISSIRPDAFLLAVSVDPVRLNEILKTSGVSPDRYNIVSVPFSEVPTHLAAADVAVLLRHPSAINSVASPVKFAEYLSCGLPVIVTSQIGDFSSLVQREGLGLVLSQPRVSETSRLAIISFLEDLKIREEKIRRRAQKVAEAQLDWGQAVNILDALYTSLWGAR
jgi:glycosyltransferase involved in cell wall biosynthesis